MPAAEHIGNAVDTVEVVGNDSQGVLADLSDALCEYLLSEVPPSSIAAEVAPEVAPDVPTVDPTADIVCGISRIL